MFLNRAARALAAFAGMVADKGNGWGQVKGKLRVEEMTMQTVDEASRVANATFWYLPGAPGKDMRASLRPDAFERARDAAAKAGHSAGGWPTNQVPTHCKYLVARDDSGRVLGTTGIYTTAQDEKEAAWLGWYSVAKRVRGKHVGTALLNAAIKDATDRGFSKLRLYTSDFPAERAARGVYERRGFKLVKSLEHPIPPYEYLFYELDLDAVRRTAACDGFEASAPNPVGAERR
jgi:GNAT superfamily N-acetyltransferase